MKKVYVQPKLENHEYITENIICTSGLVSVATGDAENVSATVLSASDFGDVVSLWD